MNKIQRKFLVSADIQRWLKKHMPKSYKTEQFYIASNSVEICYYHKRSSGKYTKVTVDGFGKKEQSPVSKEEYVLQRKKHLGRIIVKKSYEMKIDEGTIVIEKYLNELEGIYILRGYFENEKALRESQTLHELHAFVLKEIDRDDKYREDNLAVCVKPMEYNLPRLFEKIDAYESPNLFFWQVPQRIYVRDGVSLVLYRNIRLLNYYKMNFQSRHFSSTLHRLRVLLRRTDTLLETFADLYNPNVQRFCTQLLQRFYEETKVLRYLYFLNELCATREDVKLTLYSELKSLISQEEKAVTQMLLSQPFVQMINILTREVELAENQKYTTLKKEVKKTVRERLGNFEKLLGTTKEGYDDEVLEELYLLMDTLQTLIEDFFHIIGEKESHLLVNELNILLKPLREYRNCKERAAILATIKAHSSIQSLDIDPLMCVHEKELEDKIAYALKLLRGSTFNLS